MRIVESNHWDGRSLAVTWDDTPTQPQLSRISQASGICFTESGQIVLVRSGNGAWTLPGGHPENGESIDQALVREVREEACAVVERYEYLGAQVVEDPSEAVPYAQTRWWARVRLLPFEPKHETVERCLVAPEEFVGALNWKTALIAQAILGAAIAVEEREKVRQQEDEQFMRNALQVARAGLEAGELPIGAVVVLDGKVIASAHTQERAQGRLLVHADLLALEEADRIQPFPGKRRDARLYVTGEPCLMCLGAAMSFFVGEIIYGHEMPADGAVAMVRGWQRSEGDFPSYRLPRIRGGVLRDEALALFGEYAERHPSAGGLNDFARSIAALATRPGRNNITTVSAI